MSHAYDGGRNVQADWGPESGKALKQNITVWVTGASVWLKWSARGEEKYMISRHRLEIYINITPKAQTTNEKRFNKWG